MANKKITELAPMPGNQVDPAVDVLPIVDVSSGVTKKILVSALKDVLLSDVYDIGVYLPGTPQPNKLMAAVMLPRAVQFPANMAGSQARAETAPTNDVLLNLRKDGQLFGVITFPANSVNGTFTADPVTFQSGSRLEIVGPALLDLRLSGISLTFKGIRI